MASPDMNSMMRRAGNRSRALPNIGQTPAVQAANVVMGQAAVQPAMQAMAAPAGQATPAPSAPPPQVQPGPMPGMAAPAQVNPMTMTMHPVGVAADPNQYNYEPEPDGAWRVYPPGVPAPPHMAQASLPRAASTGDYRRMREAFQQQAPQAPQAPQPPMV